MKHETHFARTILTLAVLALAGFGLAQDGPTVTVNEHESLGTYLTDDAGRTLYLFVNEEMEDDGVARMTEGVRAAAAPCAGGCLEAWPPLAADAVTPGEGVDPELLYTADVDGTTMVVYNGWPLYYFANDAEAGDVAGQGLGGGANKWYVLDAEGNAVRANVAM